MKRTLAHLFVLLAAFSARAQNPVTAELTESSPPASNMLAASSGYVLDDKHKLVAGDRVSFQIVEDRTNSIPLMVAESGELDVPYMGRVTVTGKTCRQVADEIRTFLEKDYYYKATVIIGLDALSKVLGRVYVMGPVRNPGPVEIPANETFTAGKAIMRAGGFGDFANRKAVQIVRRTAEGTSTTITVNMVNVLEKGRIEDDVPLQPEDFVIVPQSKINW